MIPTKQWAVSIIVAVVFGYLLGMYSFNSQNARDGPMGPCEPLPTSPLSFETPSVETSEQSPIRRRYEISSILKSLPGWDCEHGFTDMLKDYPDPVIVEIGAYDGHNTDQFVTQGGAKRVFVFEATPSKAPMLRRLYSLPKLRDKVPPALHDLFVLRHPPGSFALRFLGQVNFSSCAVGAEHGKIVQLFTPLGTAGSSKDSLGNQDKWAPQKGSTTPVRMCAVDAIVQEHVNMLFMDCQGCEPGALKGAHTLLTHYGVDIIHTEFHPGQLIQNGYDPVQYLRQLYDLGYTCFDCDHRGHAGRRGRPGLRNFTAFAAAMDPSFKNMGEYCNLICVPI